MRRLFLGSLLLLGCPGPAGLDAGFDAGGSDVPRDVDLREGVVDVSVPDAIEAMDAPSPTDAPSCLEEGRTAGERYPAGDACNFCVCNADGSALGTDRACPDSMMGCTYDGRVRGYGERFPSSDACNECTCAASGLACTRRACTAVEEGAILLESENDPCGTNPDFTPAMVLAGLPSIDFTAPFLYDRARSSYPESLPDTEVRLRIVYDGGFLACRIPSPDQPALDIQVTLEWITADGAFDEGFPAFLRRNDFGFVDAWLLFATAPLGALNGTYTPFCPIDPGGYSFFAQLDPDGHAAGSVDRVCETDLSLRVGSFDRPAP